MRAHSQPENGILALEIRSPAPRPNGLGRRSAGCGLPRLGFGRAAGWAHRRFTPCMDANSLLEALNEAARNTASGDAVAFSPALSSQDQFRNHRGVFFVFAVDSIPGGASRGLPNIDGFDFSSSDNITTTNRYRPVETRILRRVFLRKKPGAKAITNQSLKK
jgi:hypothetical protein